MNIEQTLPPNEIINYYNNLECPQCKTKLSDINIIIFRDDFDLIGTLLSSPIKRYQAENWCPNDTEHYCNAIEWDDPKNFTVIRQDLTFYTVCNRYIITENLEDEDKTITSIRIDELTQEEQLEARPKGYHSLIGKIFDFQNFNKKAYIERIETINLFK